MTNPMKEMATHTDVEEGFRDWKQLYEKPYDKKTVDPYTKIRVILMNGTEFESVWFLHQFARHCPDNDLRREINRVRRVEQMQQKRIASLKPIDETILETTIGYEHVAVDLTAILAQREPDPYVKKALDFALLEDFDHLYRYANLLENEHGIKAENLVGKYADIMPGRPTISEFRHPFDDVRRHITASAAPITKLNVGIITAAEQQTMNYYMNVGQFYTSDAGRKLYTEIAMIEEQHVNHYGNLKDPTMTWLECWLMHEYTEAYLYYSCYKDETDPAIKKIWEQHYTQELSHLYKVAELLKKHEKKDWQTVITAPEFPELLKFGSNIDYVRRVIAETVTQSSDREDYKEIGALPDNHTFFKYQSTVNKNPASVASHAVVETRIKQKGTDYRWEAAPHPIQELQDRKKDNTEISRIKGATKTIMEKNTKTTTPKTTEKTNTVKTTSAKTEAPKTKTATKNTATKTTTTKTPSSKTTKPATPTKSTTKTPEKKTKDINKAPASVVTSSKQTNDKKPRA